MKTLFLNGKIASIDQNNTFYESIGISDNKIIFLGNNREAEKIKNDYDEIIYLNGKTILPGIIDSHMHLLNYGYTLKKLNLTKFSSIDDIILYSKNFISKNKFSNSKWLLGRGWNQDKLLEKRFIEKSDLDKISTTIPIVFTRVCGHISVCNTAALNYIQKNYVFIDNNININLDKGLFQEDALNILYSSIPSPNVEEIKSMISESCKHLIENGITSVQTDDLCTMPDQDIYKVISAYNDLNRNNNLNIRIYEQCLFFTLDSFKKFVEAGYTTGMGDNFFKIGPLKLLLDGSLGARTALLEADYSDNFGNKGIASFTQSELNEFFSISQKYNFQVAAHAIGDKAMNMFIEAINIFNENNKYISENRHGIVHAQITNYSIIQSMKKLNLIAYIQPIFLDYDIHIVEARVGQRHKESYAFKTMYDYGITVCGGSDAPVVDFNPFKNIYSAVTRKDLDGYPDSSFLPKEKLTVHEAIRIFTINSAYSSFEEKIKGSLEIGKLADFIVLNEDIFTIPEEKIKDISVDMTILDGKIAYVK